MEPFPGMQLRARLETHLRNERRVLQETLEHYALIFDDVSQEDLKAYLRPVQFFWLGDSFVLGTQQGFEPHGGGLLRLIWTWWRPDSRAAQPGDRFWFEPNRAGLELGRIYRGHQRQIFLPVPGKAPDEIRGEIPQAGQLPRMRFAGPSWPMSPVEVDSYHFLGLLMDRQRDYRETWTNQLGQQLSTDLLLRNAGDFYLASPVADLEPDDHSALHLVEILLEFHRRREQGGAAPARRLDPNASSGASWPSSWRGTPSPRTTRPCCWDITSSRWATCWRIPTSSGPRKSGSGSGTGWAPSSGSAFGTSRR
jgi:hypothetical protein